MYTSAIILLLASTISFTIADPIPQATTAATAPAATASPDGQIVPFSQLPACASLCGHLFDVQGACTPPVTSTVSEPCFCGDPRLQPFQDAGTAGVSSVCGPQSCTADADLLAIQKWYDSYCNINQANPTTTTSGAPGATGTSSGGGSSPATSAPVNQTWIQSHYRWVIMLAVIVFAIIFGWIGAVCIRKRYLRKKEREIEMKPPIAWGPHQMQASTGGYNYGDGVVRAAAPGEKMAAASTMPTGGEHKRLSKGFLGRSRT